MSVGANLTSKERAKLIALLCRCHDMPLPVRLVESSPKRLVYPGRLTALRKELSLRRATCPGWPPGGPELAGPGQPPVRQ